MPRACFLLLILCLPLIVGCEGCRSPRERTEEEEQAAAVQDFTAQPAEIFPSGMGPVSGGVKPGHWVTAAQTLKSNKVDQRGQLRSRAIATGKPLSTEANSSSETQSIQSVRPVVLPQGQQRTFDFRFLAPLPSAGEQGRVMLESRFVSSASTFFDTGRQPFYVMAGEEYFFVILTSRPERFAKFQIADWVRPLRDEVTFQTHSANYRVVIPPTDRLLPLAETMLDWTSTAVVLWDDLAAEALTPGQATAMADWLRFGGQLIVNGATASDRIAKTTMAEVLPLRPARNVELDVEAGAELLENWAVPSDRSTEKQIALLRSQSARIAMDGPLHSDTVSLPDAGGLLLTRRVGRGRVVQTRFDLTSDWISSWDSFDSFINAAVLLRPPREFVESVDALSQSLVAQRYVADQSSRATPAMNTRFRITGRDALLPSPTVGTLRKNADPELATDQAPTPLPATVGFGDPWSQSDAISGISAWTDHSDLLRTTREVLMDEAGIEIPDSSLIANALFYYLLLLVPVNYLVFRLLGRLEYAWLAVPVLAIGGALVVARLARLDIGFARSQTELAVLEVHAGYPRAHLSRMVAIYNSLSSQYRIAFATRDAAALPVMMSSSDEFPDLVFSTSFAEGPSLDAVAVASGRTQHLHAEQMVDIGGSITRQEDSILNASVHSLFDVFVVEKSVDGKMRVAIVGALASAARVPLRFREIAAAPITEDLPMQTAVLLRRLASSAAMPPGTSRLVGRIDGSIPGMQITPASQQLAAQTIVLAHLTVEPLPLPVIDVNLISDLRRMNRLDENPNPDDPTRENKD